MNNLLPGLSGVIPIKNGDALDYAWRETARSILPIVNELIFSDGGSTDGTREAIAEWAQWEPKIRLVDFPWPDLPTYETVSKGLPGPPGQPRMLVDWLNHARQFCRYEMAINTDADEILDPAGYDAVREAVAKKECRWFYRLHFWRDHRHVTQDDKVVGSYVARLGPTELEMVSDEPRHEGEPLIRLLAKHDKRLRFFHVGFIRKPAAFFAKSKVVQPWIANSYDPRLLDAETRNVSWFDTTDVGELVPFNERMPEVLHDWLHARGYGQRIIHLWHWMGDVDEDTHRRLMVSRQSREEEYIRAGGDWHAPGLTFSRNSLEVGDTAPVPFVRDMIDQGFQGFKSRDDIIFLTNADVGFRPGITQLIAQACRDHGAVHMRRREFMRVECPLTAEDMAHGDDGYPGMDGCAFTVKWWAEHGYLFPDMIYGRYGWDSAMRNLIRRGGGVELKDVLWHETHVAAWNATPETIEQNAANAHNRKLLHQWIAEFGGSPEDHLYTLEQLAYR